jgi:hypothetical protein
MTNRKGIYRRGNYASVGIVELQFAHKEFLWAGIPPGHVTISAITLAMNLILPINVVSKKQKFLTKFFL